MKYEINKLHFVDNLLIDFRVEENLQSLVVTFESYYSKNQESEKVEKGIFKISISKILKSNFELNPDFAIDLKREYNKEGNHFRSNEIYGISENQSNSGRVVALKADFLEMTISCQNVELSRLGDA